MTPLTKLALLLAALPISASPSSKGRLPEEAPGLDRLESRQAVLSDIIGGTDAHITEFPFIVAFNRIIDHSDYQWCDGVLINANTVLTVAHCLINKTDISSIRIRAGSSIFWKGGVTAGVTDWIAYPGYNGTTSKNDVALLRLSHPIKEESSTIRYATLPCQDFYPAVNTSIRVPGWGISANHNETSPDTLKTITIPVLSRAECQASYDFYYVIYNFDTSAFCADLRHGGRDPCDGDSGSPAVDPDGVVVGIVSRGAIGPCNVTGAYTAFTNMGHFIDWIDKNKF